MPTAAGLTTDTRRFEQYFRLSLYALFLIEPLVLLLAAANGTSVLLLVLGLAQTVLNVLVCRWAFAAMRRRSRRPAPGRERALLVVWLAVSVAVIVLVVLEIPDVVGTSAVALLLAVPLAAPAPALRPREIVVAAAATGVAAVLLAGSRQGFAPVPSLLVGVSAFVIVVLLVLSFWLSGWMVRVVWALDEARSTTAQLAVAEERLRISRDLHDLFGRTLAAVSVKSELAAELLRRGRSEEALREIGAVRGLADTSGQQVREVVGGVRRADLTAELHGARSLLSAAGIRCETSGEDVVGEVDPTAGDTLGAVLREAVTNVIRHSRASECFVTLEVGPGRGWRLTVTNDGAEATARSGGTGLRGMGERLAAVGGSLRHDLLDGRFTVEATVPRSARRVAGVGA